MKKVLMLTFLTVGTIIGAGFATGRELLSFFGERPSPLSALLSALLIFACCLLFLSVGARLKANDVGTVNAKIGGRLLSPVLSIGLLFNSAVSLSAMLAGMNSLFDTVLPLSPIYAIVAAGLSTLVVVCGLKGLGAINRIIVPIMIVVMAVICALVFAGGGIYDAGIYGVFYKTYNAFTYVGMNMLLAAAVLTTVHDTTRKQRLAASALTAAILGGLMLLIMIALNKSNVSHADMPLLMLSAEIHPILYGLAVAAVAFAIFTTMITAHYSLYAWLKTLVGGSVFAAAAVAVTGLIFSFFGFKNVVDYLYPAVGVIGLIYAGLCIHYLFKGAAPAFSDKLFQRGNGKIHQCGKCAKHHNR